MRTGYVLALVALTAMTCGCSMFKAWKSIPPPGGCDTCHTISISYDWKVTYQAPHLTDERNKEYFQSAQSVLPTGSKPASPLDVRKVEELKCFDCHRSPDPKHVERVGRYHH